MNKNVIGLIRKVASINADGFIKKVNNINTIFAILLTSFPQYISSILQFEIQPKHIDHVLWFTMFVLFFLVNLAGRYFIGKQYNEDELGKSAVLIAHVVSGAILFLPAPFVIYFAWLDKNYGQYLMGDGDIGNLLLLIPFGVTISAAMSQTAYIIEKKSKIRIVILIITTVLLFGMSRANISPIVMQTSASIYFILLFLLANLKKK